MTPLQMIALVFTAGAAVASLAVAVGMQSLMQDMVDRIATQEAQMDRLLDVLDRYAIRLSEVAR